MTESRKMQRRWPLTLKDSEYVVLLSVDGCSWSALTKVAIPDYVSPPYTSLTRSMDESERRAIHIPMTGNSPKIVYLSQKEIKNSLCTSQTPHFFDISIGEKSSTKVRIFSSPSSKYGNPHCHGVLKGDIFVCQINEETDIVDLEVIQKPMGGLVFLKGLCDQFYKKV